MKAVWPDFFGSVVGAWAALGGFQTIQKCGGPTFSDGFKAPRGRPDPKNRPKKIRPDCLQVPSKPYKFIRFGNAQRPQYPINLYGLVTLTSQNPINLYCLVMEGSDHQTTPPVAVAPRPPGLLCAAATLLWEAAAPRCTSLGKP